MILLVLIVVALPLFVVASEPESEKSPGEMNNQHIDTLIKRLDKNARRQGTVWQFTVENKTVTVITDEKADRMRILVPVIESSGLDDKSMYRVLQANFDSALDARYSIAKGVLWSAFIHPLASLDEKLFLSGVGQVINLSMSYGESYSSGGLVFRGGDSESLQRRKLIDELIKKGLAT